jgi:succinyl-diaminopimelate desuccinylase
MNSTLDFTQELIRLHSVTPADAGCQTLLAQRLAAAGFEIEWLPFGDVTNMWAHHGTPKPTFCFAGHTDVVPAGDHAQWTSNPFVPTVRDGLLFGRGAADMKSSLAAMTDAAIEYVRVRPNHKGRIAFLITSDEEGRAADGTRRVMQTLSGRGETIESCLIGEPSCGEMLGDTIRVGRRGSLSGIITVHGVEGHVAYPHLSRNPIQLFAHVIDDLYSKPLDNGNEFFPPSSFQVVQISSGGEAPNVIPGKLNARFNVRYSTVWTYQQLQQHFEKALTAHGIDYSLRWHLSGEPFLTPLGDFVTGVTKAIESVTGVRPESSTGGGTSDGRFIAPSGTHVVEFGAVNKSIHKVDEYVRVADIDTMKRVYLRVLENTLA